MPLTVGQTQALQARARQLVEAVATTGYTYDQNYGRKYSRGEVLTVFGKAAPSITLTTDDLNDLVGTQGFCVTKRALARIGARLLRVAEPTDSDAAKFAALVLLWGYASQSHGAYRVGGILSGDRVRLGQNAVVSLKALEAGDLSGAYQTWLGQRHIHGLGEPSFTRILYFLGKAISPDTPLALIKDRVVSERAATVFAMPLLRDRSLGSYLAYIEVLAVCSQATGFPKERLEEFLSSVPPASLPGYAPFSAIQEGFPHAEAVVNVG